MSTSKMNQAELIARYNSFANELIDDTAVSERGLIATTLINSTVSAAETTVALATAVRATVAVTKEEFRIVSAISRSKALSSGDKIALLRAKLSDLRC